ncbi:MAG: hypothetical protein ACQXXH_02635 [Candidatus Bathyarchaeia archaeon]|nr:hypothetical protein [Candidatus Bathyarchaeota archaeon A05DMB-4]MDH7594641.1 hypothetical protein [Candidatus Bathyarchaeota archaeon]
MLGTPGNLFFAGLLAALVSVGGPPTSGYSLSLFWKVMIFTPFLLAFISLIASIGILTGAKYAWYLSIILWISSAPYYCIIALFLPPNLKPIIIGAITPIIALIIYFQTKPVKNYFLKPK